MVALLPLVLGSVLATAAPRYAVIIGANHGADSEATLRFAESDAARVGDTLQALGAFAAADVTLLQHPTPSDVRRAFDALAARARAAAAAPDSLLFVYFAGHADAATLHLGREPLAWPELVRLTRQTGIRARLLAVDACRGDGLAGDRSVTRVESLAGLAIVASVSPDEGSRESALSGGAHFTQHLLAALSGVGDINGDGRVSVYEAVQYSAARSIEADHDVPAHAEQLADYRFRLDGNAALTLTAPIDVARLSTLHLAAPGWYTVRPTGGAAGPPTVVLVPGPTRTLWLPPGTYTVQRRDGHVAYGGTVRLPEGGGAWLAAESLAAR